MNPSDLTPVKSSNVAAVGHDGTALYVQFHGSKGKPPVLYRYPTAGKEHHEAMLATDSPGRYVLDRIRNHHAGERVG